MKEIVIVGGGGHAKVLISTIESMRKFSIRGIIDAGLSKGSKIADYQVLGDDGCLTQIRRAKPLLANGIGMIEVPSKRQFIYEKYKKLGFRFPVIVHAKAIVAQNVKIGNGTQVMAGAIVQPGAEIDENVIINTGAIIEHDSVIAHNCHLAPGAILGGAVKIGPSSFVGMGARILPGVKIGAHVLIGAGAVVIKNISDDKVVVGVPAHELKKKKIL